MVTTAFAKIWGETAGAVAWDARSGLARFEYGSGFISTGWELSPIKMPLSDSIFSFPELKVRGNEAFNSFKGLPGLLADVLPDKYGNQLINAWLAKNGRPENSMNPVEKLCFIGTRGIGALEFEPATLASPQQPFNVEIDSLVNIAQKMLAKRKGFEANIEKDEQQAMQKILRIGTSAGGARPKAIVAYNPKTGAMQSGQTTAPAGFEHWLIKLDGVSDAQFGESDGYGRVEMAYYLMATDCGIDMMESRLLEENDRAHFMTKRFDRTPDNQKHHVQTLCALQHYDFNDVHSFSYEQLFQTMRLLRLPYPQAEQMFRRMAFNVAARNCDDHTKNFAFMLKKNGVWELAPAYDICHAYRPGSPWVNRHSLSINSKREHINRADLMTVARSMHIKKADAIMDEVNATVSDWEDYAKQTKVAAELRDAIADTLITIT